MAKAQAQKTITPPRLNRSQRRAAAARASFPEPVSTPAAPVVPIESEKRVAPTVEAIRARAYALYLARSGAPGQPIDDWVQAERQLLAG
jgi:hypothetical protein